MIDFKQGMELEDNISSDKKAKKSKKIFHTLGILAILIIIFTAILKQKMNLLTVVDFIQEFLNLNQSNLELKLIIWVVGTCQILKLFIIGKIIN